MTDPTPDQIAAARAYVAANVTINSATLTAALEAIYGDSYVTGLLAAAQQTGRPVAALGGLHLPSTPTGWAAFWDAWTPGNIPAASLLDSGGLASLLDGAGITIKGITGTILDGLGSALAQGVADGLGTDEIARNLSGWLADPTRAQIIATTETARAVSTASLDSYQETGVQQIEWLLSPGACEICQEYADESPFILGEEPDLPAHPWCRCSWSPLDPGSG